MVTRLSGLAAPAALAALAALAMGDRAGAATTVARPTADLYVSALHPPRNYGTAPGGPTAPPSLRQRAAPAAQLRHRPAPAHRPPPGVACLRALPGPPAGA